MSISVEDIRSKVSEYLKTEFLNGSDLEQFNDSTELISSGIMDSISTLQLVDFLEKSFNVEFSPHEVDQENLNSVNIISDFVKAKMG